MEPQNILNIMVVWRGKQMNVEAGRNSKVEELGKKLHKLTNVKPDTMKLLVPQSSNKTSKLITPFSDEHSHLSLQETAIVEGKPIRMMGVFDDEIEEVSQSKMKSDSRIAGFDEEEKRLRQRLLSRPRASLKLPQGAYIFCDFQTLHIPGIELNPPPSEALRRMHMLACDPGIVAIMNKHRWRVGLMTEMAPVGYVGISPKCLLGFNKNQGEEISLRLRTDDLKGFRKYESIKKTLLHELAHMVYGEHDADFFAFDKQLNQEATSLDWTKSRSHTLSDHKFSDQYDEDILIEETNYSGQKLGGTRNSVATARASSAAAAYRRFVSASTNSLEGSQVPAEGAYTNGRPDAATEPDPDEGELKGGQEQIHAEPDPDDVLDMDEGLIIIADNDDPYSESLMRDDDEPDPDDRLDNERMFEPDPDESNADEDTVPTAQVDEAVKSFAEPVTDDYGMSETMNDQMEQMLPVYDYRECDPSGCAEGVVLESPNMMTPDSRSSQATEIARAEPDRDDRMDRLNSQELQIIEEPVAAICTRLQKAIEMLRSEVTPTEAMKSLQTLFKIIRNVIDHPDEVKFRRLRKANPGFQRNVANYKAAMEVLSVVGFCEDVVSDEVGGAETYMVLKRNDPGLLWLAKSSLEVAF